MAGNLIQSGKEKEPMGRFLREEAANKMAADWIRHHLVAEFRSEPVLLPPGVDR